MNKRLISTSFGKAASQYTREAVAQQTIVDRLCNTFREYRTGDIYSVLEIGCGTGTLSRNLEQLFPDAQITCNDLSPEMEAYLPAHVRFLPGDAETIDLKGKYDLIISASTLQWFSNRKKFFAHIGQHLNAGAMLVFSSFGPDNLSEIRAITGNGLSYDSMSEVEKMVSPFFDIHYLQEEKITLYFKTPLEVLHHLKKTGVNGIGASAFQSKGRLEKFCSSYLILSEKENLIPLTYHPIYCIGTLK